MSETPINSDETQKASEKTATDQQYSDFRLCIQPSQLFLIF